MESQVPVEEDLKEIKLIGENQTIKIQWNK